MREFFNRARSRFSAMWVALAAMLVPGLAAAQAGGTPDFDPAPILAIVTSAQEFIVAIGMAVLIMLMVAKGIKWARRAG